MYVAASSSSRRVVLRPFPLTTGLRHYHRECQPRYPRALYLRRSRRAAQGRTLPKLSATLQLTDGSI